MKYAEIARKVNCSEPHVMNVLTGQRNPNTRTGKLIIEAAADIHALQCRQEFIEEFEREYKFKTWLKKHKKEQLKKATR